MPKVTVPSSIRHNGPANASQRGGNSYDRRGGGNSSIVNSGDRVDTSTPVILSTRVLDTEADEIQSEVIGGQSLLEKERICNEKEQAVLDKMESELSLCRQAYAAAVRSQPDFLNVNVDPSVRSHALLNGTCYSRLILNQSVVSFKRLGKNGVYTVDTECIALHPMYAQKVEETVDVSSIPDIVFDRIEAATSLEEKQQILRANQSLDEYHALLEDYLARPAKASEVPGVTFTLESSIARQSVLYSGIGYCRFTTNLVYEGEWKDGKMHGKGVLAWTDGTVYQGTLVNGEIEGRGRQTYKDGSYYIGEFTEGYRHGVGIWVFAAAHQKYTGCWRRGRRHGRGKMVYSADSFYYGDWVNGQRDGQGLMKYEEAVYTGAWSRDEREGDGVVVFFNGDVYNGQFARNIMQGKGEYVWGPKEEMLDLDQSQYIAAYIDTYPLPSLHGCEAYVSGIKEVFNTGISHLDSSSLQALAYADVNPHSIPGMYDCKEEAVLQRRYTLVGKHVLANSCFEVHHGVEDMSVLDSEEFQDSALISIHEYLHDEQLTTVAVQHEAATLFENTSVGEVYNHLDKETSPLLPFPATIAKFLSKEVNTVHERSTTGLYVVDPKLRQNRYLGEFVDGQRHGHGTQLFTSGASYTGAWSNGTKHGKGVFVFDNGLKKACEFVKDQEVSDIWSDVNISHWYIQVLDQIQEQLTLLSPNMQAPSEKAPLLVGETAEEQRKARFAWMRQQRSKQQPLESLVDGQLNRLARVLARYSSVLFETFQYYQQLDEGCSTELGEENKIILHTQDDVHSMYSGITLKQLRVSIRALTSLCSDQGMLDYQQLPLEVSDIVMHRYLQHVNLSQPVEQHEDHIVYERYMSTRTDGQCVLLPRQVIEAFVRICSLYSDSHEIRIPANNVEQQCQEETKAVLQYAQEKCDGVVYISNIPVWCQVKYVIEYMLLRHAGGRYYLNMYCMHGTALLNGLVLSEQDSSHLLSETEEEEKHDIPLAIRNSLTPRGNTEEYDFEDNHATALQSIVREAMVPVDVWPATPRIKIGYEHPRWNDIYKCNEDTHTDTILQTTRTLVNVYQNQLLSYQCAQRTCEPYTSKNSVGASLVQSVAQASICSSRTTSIYGGTPCLCIACAKEEVAKDKHRRISWSLQVPASLSPPVHSLTVHQLAGMLYKHKYVTIPMYTSKWTAQDWLSTYVQTTFSTSLFVPHTHHSDTKQTSPSITSPANNTDTPVTRVRTAGKSRKDKEDVTLSIAQMERMVIQKQMLQYQQDVNDTYQQRVYQEELSSDHELSYTAFLLLTAGLVSQKVDSRAQHTIRLLCMLAYRVVSSHFYREAVMQTHLQAWRSRILATERVRTNDSASSVSKSHKKGNTSSNMNMNTLSNNNTEIPFMVKVQELCSSTEVVDNAVGLTQLTVLLQAHRAGLRASRAVLEIVMQTINDNTFDCDVLVKHLQACDRDVSVSHRNIVVPECTHSTLQMSVSNEQLESPASDDVVTTCVQCSEELLQLTRDFCQPLERLSKTVEKHDKATALVQVAEELCIYNRILGNSDCLACDDTIINQERTSLSSILSDISVPTNTRNVALSSINVVLLHRQSLLGTNEAVPSEQLESLPLTSFPLSVICPQLTHQIDSFGIDHDYSTLFNHSLQMKDISTLLSQVVVLKSQLTQAKQQHNTVVTQIITSPNFVVHENDELMSNKNFVTDGEAQALVHNQCRAMPIIQSVSSVNIAIVQEDQSLIMNNTIVCTSKKHQEMLVNYVVPAQQKGCGENVTRRSSVGYLDRVSEGRMEGAVPTVTLRHVLPSQEQYTTTETTVPLPLAMIEAHEYVELFTNGKNIENTGLLMTPRGTVSMTPVDTTQTTVIPQTIYYTPTPATLQKLDIATDILEQDQQNMAMVQAMSVQATREHWKTHLQTLIMSTRQAQCTCKPVSSVHSPYVTPYNYSVSILPTFISQLPYPSVSVEEGASIAQLQEQYRECTTACTCNEEAFCLFNPTCRDKFIQVQMQHLLEREISAQMYVHTQYSLSLQARYLSNKQYYTSELQNYALYVVSGSRLLSPIDAEIYNTAVLRFLSIPIQNLRLFSKKLNLVGSITHLADVSKPVHSLTCPVSITGATDDNPLCPCYSEPASYAQDVALQVMYHMATTVGPYRSVDNSETFKYQARPGVAALLAKLAAQVQNVMISRQKSKKSKDTYKSRH